MAATGGIASEEIAASLACFKPPISISTSPNIRKMSKPPYTKLVSGAVVALVTAVVCYYQVRRLKMQNQIQSAAKRAVAVYDALFAYAYDHDSSFPNKGTATTSNAALNVLYREGMISGDGILGVTGSKWSSAAWIAHTGVPDVIENSPLPGRNHWAYNADLSLNSPTSKVLMCDGFCDGQLYWYSKTPDEYGGVWGGENFISLSVAGAAKIIPISGQEGARVSVQDLADFSGGVMLNPAKPTD